MNMTYPVDIIHIGFPKTGTSLIQGTFLANDERFASIGKPHKIDRAHRALLDRLVYIDDYDFRAEDFIKELKEIEQKNPGSFEGKKSIVSFELLSGDLFTRRGSLQLLHRLKEIFGDKPRIIITIREQSSAIESLYRYYVMGGGTLSCRDFIYSKGSPAVDMWEHPLLLEKFRYDDVINACRDLFGKDDVYVLPYEYLKNEGREAFTTRFCQACGFEGWKTFDMEKKVEQRLENRSLSYIGVHGFRQLNKIISTPYSPGGLKIPGDGFLPVIYRHYSEFERFVLAPFSGDSRFVDAPRKSVFIRLVKKCTGRYDRAQDDLLIADDIRAAYKNSNQNTQALTGFDLKKLGYSV